MSPLDEFYHTVSYVPTLFHLFVAKFIRPSNRSRSLITWTKVTQLNLDMEPHDVGGLQEKSPSDAFSRECSDWFRSGLVTLEQDDRSTFKTSPSGLQTLELVDTYLVDTHLIIRF